MKPAVYKQHKNENRIKFWVNIKMQHEVVERKWLNIVRSYRSLLVN